MTCLSIFLSYFYVAVIKDPDQKICVGTFRLSSRGNTVHHGGKCITPGVGGVFWSAYHIALAVLKQRQIKGGMEGWRGGE